MMTIRDSQKRSADNAVREIRWAPRRHYSAEEKSRIVFEGLRDENSIAELCRREGINAALIDSKNWILAWYDDMIKHGACG